MFNFKRKSKKKKYVAIYLLSNIFCDEISARNTMNEVKTLLNFIGGVECSEVMESTIVGYIGRSVYYYCKLKYPVESEERVNEIILSCSNKIEVTHYNMFE